MEPMVIQNDTLGYKNLVAVAKILEALSPNNAEYKVETVYFDLGQEWRWTTICRYRYEECQVLSPKQWGDVVLACGMEDITKVVEDIRNDEYFGDR